MAPHHPQPTTPMESLVVLVKKLSKMAGNSASKPLNSTPNELPCITVEWWRIAWKKLCAFSRYTAFNISNRYFSIFVIACIRPLLANPVTYIDLSLCSEKNCGLEFISFKVASVYMFPQSNDMFTKSSDMLNKNTLGVKKCKVNNKQPYLCEIKSFDIN